SSETDTPSGQNDHMQGNAMGAPSVQNDQMQLVSPAPPSGQDDHNASGHSDQVHLGQIDQLLTKEQRLQTETSPETSSSAHDDEPDPHADLLTAADAQDIEAGRFSKRIASAINAKTKAELLKELPARKAWDKLSEREKAIAFKTAQ